MKKFKYLLAITLVVCSLFTIAFAADTFVANDIVYSGTGDIVVKFGTTYGVGYDFTCDAVFNKDKFTAGDLSNPDDMSVSKRKPNTVKTGIVTTVENQEFSFKLSPKDGVTAADIYGETIEFKNIAVAFKGVPQEAPATKTITIKADTPVVNKYNVTFTDYESENMTDVEENTEITLPAAPAVDKNKEFVGWSDGTTTYEAGAKYTVTGNVTFTAVINDITLPTPVATKEGIISAEVDGKTYTDIFEGIYTLTPGKASLTKFGVKIPGKINPADVREFATSGTFEGEGTFVYRVALFGVMDKADIAATPFAE